MGVLQLTFDDGPDAAWTGRLLDVLEASGARATFFPIAGRAAAQAETVRRMVAAGHVVGLHCHEHVRHSQQTRTWLEHDTARALDTLGALGVEPTLWRTPWGATAEWTAEVAAAADLRLVAWSVDTHDWRGDSASEMFAATVDELHDGAIVLAHDGIGPGARRADARETVAYVERVAAYAAEVGLDLEAIR